MTGAGWTGRIAGLAGLEEDLRAELESRSRIVRLPAGATVFSPGQAADHLLLMLRGTVRVSQISGSGREIVLYRVEAGESCVMTTACMIGDQDYPAEGVAETEVEAVALPRAVFDDLAARSAMFRAFVFRAYAQRITDLFRIIDEVAFGHIDIRLAQRLLALAGDGGEVRITHQQLATELGTAREVISRQLQEFQRRGWIAQARGAVKICNRRALAALGQG
ncbi:MAG: Crp/Fnr family transcriptional regulator [Rhodobacteraceae bacterium]|nr:Crp/Fnr family transcriptional regulator [Paracoccaceae bacterium]